MNISLLKISCVIFALCIGNLSLAGENSAAIKAKVEQLKDKAMSFAKYQGNGATIQEIVQNFAVSQTEENVEDLEFFWNQDYAEMSDNMSFGSLSVDGAEQLVESVADYVNENEDAYSNGGMKEIKKMLRELNGLGATFSWNPFGNSVCGVNFTNLLIIDVSTGEIYEIDFYGSMIC